MLQTDTRKNASPNSKSMYYSSKFSKLKVKQMFVDQVGNFIFFDLEIAMGR